MSACIYYQPDGYSTAGPKLMGRNAAGESFLRGYFQYSRAPEFRALVKNREFANQFAETARRFDENRPVRPVSLGDPRGMTEVGTIYLPDPHLTDHAFFRAASGHASWSLCGITHTTASLGAMRSIADTITAPVQPWDALICTSTAVKDHVQRIRDAEIERLQERFGLIPRTDLQLPVIPLGIHTGDFEASDAARNAARRDIGAGEDSLVVLYLGRLSFHAKAHPLPMYLALEKAAKATGKHVILVECGWFAADFIEKAFVQASDAVCSGVEIRRMDGRDPARRATAWAAADVFCSLVDNIQETFGITPVEAMAAGLPVVVSDWDGYRETVRDGTDGFRIPTYMPPEGQARGLATRHGLGIDSYDSYLRYVASLIAVDIEETVKAFTRLFEDAGLRKKMGNAGRQRAWEIYDWKAIILRYEALWEELATVRAAAGARETSVAQPWPLGMDPFHAFSAYPTHRLSGTTRYRRSTGDLSKALDELRVIHALDVSTYARLVLPSLQDAAVVLETAVVPSTVNELVRRVPRERQSQTIRGLAWLVKVGLLHVVPSDID